jgi:hypothetical protein
VLANAYIHGLGENEPAGRKYIGDLAIDDGRSTIRSPITQSTIADVFPLGAPAGYHR